MWQHDVFISHASEDKDDFVRSLAEALRELHLEVWYDEFTLRVGDSLRRSIDRGLRLSRYGIVVLSPNFFRKNWAQRELDGLVARETAHGERVILPVWHQVSREDVLEFSPPLADTVAADTRQGVRSVARQLAESIRPRGSPLVLARNDLLELGLTPPSVTDEWWLDVVEASSREYPWGYSPHREHWDRWSFWLPSDDGTPEARGARLVRTALQLLWTEEARTRPITQITAPEVVLEFIASETGLADTCHEHPRFLATYAPQLTVAGFGGEFERDFDTLLESSTRENDQRLATSAASVGSRPRSAPGSVCDEYIALRHPTFGSCSAAGLACQFVQGDIPGPPVKFYETIDYIAWLLSDASVWLPERVRSVLLDGMGAWATWPSSDGFESGALTDRLVRSRNARAFKMTSKPRRDLESRLARAQELLGLPESAQVLSDRFLAAGFIETYFAVRERRARKRPG